MVQTGDENGEGARKTDQTGRRHHVHTIRT